MFTIGTSGREDNPDWERYYTPRTAPKFGEVGEVYDKLTLNSIQVGKMSLIRSIKYQDQTSNQFNFMPRKSKSGIGSTNPVPFGMSNRVMKRKKPINLDYIKKIEPLTENQETFFESYKQDKNLVAYGCSWYRKDLYHPLQRPYGRFGYEDTLREDLHRQVPCTHQRDWFPSW